MSLNLACARLNLGLILVLNLKDFFKNLDLQTKMFYQIIAKNISATSQHHKLFFLKSQIHSLLR